MKTTTISAGMLAVSLSGLFAFANDTLLLEPSPDEGSLAGEPVIRVSGIDDVHVLRTDTTKKSISVLNQACIFTSGMRYGVRALESENRFNLSNGITRLPYTVTFNGQRLDRNAGVSGLYGENRQEDCAGGFNASYAVTLDPAAFNTAPAGRYTDTLTLLISAE